MKERLWTKDPPKEQGWYWALPNMPEDANPEIICVWLDDMYWSYGEQGRSSDFYKKFMGPIPEPEPKPRPGFFVCSRQEAIESILKLGDRICCYMGGPWRKRRCDCKYGGPVGRGGEQTGCPELRTILYVIENMEDRDWVKDNSPNIGDIV